MRDLELMMRDYRLTTAEILYHFPDHPSLLQTYVWQALDLPPRFPRLKSFLDYWEASLDGKLHSVKIASAQADQARPLPPHPPPAAHALSSVRVAGARPPPWPGSRALDAEDAAGGTRAGKPILIDNRAAAIWLPS